MGTVFDVRAVDGANDRRKWANHVEFLMSFANFLFILWKEYEFILEFGDCNGNFSN
jgi:hypothetical protein